MANHFTTYRRYENELWELVDRLIREKLDYVIINTHFHRSDLTEEMHMLERDKPFVIQNMPTEIEAYININDQDVSYEKMSEVLLCMAEVCREENIHVSTFSIRIDKENKKDKEEGTEGKIHLSLYDIPAELLKEESLPKALEVFGTE